MNRNLNEAELGDQRGKLSCPAAIAEPNRTRLFSPGNNSANEMPETLCFLETSQLSFPFSKRVFLPLLCGTGAWLTMVANPEL